MSQSQIPRTHYNALHIGKGRHNPRIAPCWKCGHPFIGMADPFKRSLNRSDQWILFIGTERFMGQQPPGGKRNLTLKSGILFLNIFYISTSSSKPDQVSSGIHACLFQFYKLPARCWLISSMFTPRLWWTTQNRVFSLIQFRQYSSYILQ